MSGDCFGLKFPDICQIPVLMVKLPIDVTVVAGEWTHTQDKRSEDLKCMKRMSDLAQGW